jgi:hypothetical protein
MRHSRCRVWLKRVFHCMNIRYSVVWCIVVIIMDCAELGAIACAWTLCVVCLAIFSSGVQNHFAPVVTVSSLIGYILPTHGRCLWIREKFMKYIKIHNCTRNSKTYFSPEHHVQILRNFFLPLDWTKLWIWMNP